MKRAKKKNMIETVAGEAVRAFADASTAVARLRSDIPDRELIDGIAKDGSTRGDGLVVLDTILGCLVSSGRVYAHHADVMLTTTKNSAFRLLAVDGRTEPNAGAWLSNIVAGVQCKVNERTGEIETWEFKLPDSICHQIFANDACMTRLPVVTTYATHSVFDSGFRLRGPGYHPDQQILVQGLALEPAMSSLPAAPRTAALTVGEAVDRLPPHLRHLLKDFDWAGVVDLTNAIGALLMGLLMNHFIEDGHPAVFIRGNQPTIGKSLLAKVIGMVFDGRRVAPIRKSGDEEFDKLLCGMCKKRRRMVFLDNLRNKLDSERIEQIITSPTLMLRILGTNDFGEWPNDVLFVLTSNNLVAGRDLVSRNVVIDLYTEGDPRKRQKARKTSRPLRYASDHRAEILGELAAMVLKWVDAGHPNGELTTRFDHVMQVVGGILTVNGFPGFASNADAAAVEMDEDMQRMLQLLEEIVAAPPGSKDVVEAGGDASKAGRAPGDWVKDFERLGLIDTKAAHEATARSKSVLVGKMLSRFIGTPLTVETAARRVVVTIRKRQGTSGNKVFYYVEVGPTLAGAESSPVGSDVAPSPVEAEAASPVDTKPATARSRSNSALKRRPDGWLNAAKEINTAPAPSKAKVE
jgi:hypothetical protein